MTADRTQHVLDAIDGALEDWSVSDDAMRWTPEPVEPAVWRVDYSHWSLSEPLQPQPVDWSAVEYIEGRAPQAHATLTALSLDEAPGQLFPARWISAALDAYGSAIRAACDADAERLHRMLNPTPEALDMRAQILRAFDLTPAEAGFEPDPRAHALHLRRTRNTGPERKPAGRQKRPREL